MLAKLTILPQPFSRIPPTKARQRLKVPVTFTAKVAAHSSGVISHSGLFGPTIPALLIRMSTGPMRSAAAATAAGSQLAQRAAQQLQPLGRLLGRAQIWLGDDLRQRRASPV